MGVIGLWGPYRRATFQNRFVLLRVLCRVGWTGLHRTTIFHANLWVSCTEGCVYAG